MDLRPSCAHCKSAMDMANIRANPEGSGFVCRTCLEVKVGKKDTLGYNSQIKSKVVFDKKNYLCEDCGYTFERNATFYVADCPMCAKENVQEIIIEKEAVAQPQEADSAEWLYE